MGPEATAAAQDSGWERRCRGQGKERCWGGGVCARVHVEVPVPGRALVCVRSCMLLRSVCVWPRHSCRGAVLPNIHTCRGWRGGAGPPACLSHLRRDFPGLAGAAGVGGPVKGFGSLWVLLFFPV